jgi:uncharacterized integral membrane protein
MELSNVLRLETGSLIPFAIMHCPPANAVQFQELQRSFSHHIARTRAGDLAEAAVRTIVALLVLLVAVTLAVQNAAMVTVKVFVWQMQASLAIVVGACVFAGVLIGVLISAPRLRRMRRDHRRLRARLSELGEDPDTEPSDPVTPTRSWWTR